jgi:hypothetical protein
MDDGNATVPSDYHFKWLAVLIAMSKLHLLVHTGILFCFARYITQANAGTHVCWRIIYSSIVSARLSCRPALSQESGPFCHQWSSVCRQFAFSSGLFDSCIGKPKQWYTASWMKGGSTVRWARRLRKVGLSKLWLAGRMRPTVHVQPARERFE